jgi:hypothetical protein
MIVITLLFLLLLTVLYAIFPLGAIQAFVLAAWYWRRPHLIRPGPRAMLVWGAVFTAISYLLLAERLHLYPFR